MRLICRKCGTKLDVPEDIMEFECPKCHRILDVQYELLLNEEVDGVVDDAQDVQEDSQEKKKKKNYQDYARTFVYHLGCSLMLPLAAVGVFLILRAVSNFFSELVKALRTISTAEEVCSSLNTLCSPIMLFLSYFLVVFFASKKILIHSLWFIGDFFKFVFLLALSFLIVVLGFNAVDDLLKFNLSFMPYLLIVFWSIVLLYELYLMFWLPIKSARAIPNDISNMKRTFHQRKQICEQNEIELDAKKANSLSLKKIVGGILHDIASSEPYKPSEHFETYGEACMREANEYIARDNDDILQEQKEREGWA